MTYNMKVWNGGSNNEVFFIEFCSSGLLLYVNYNLIHIGARNIVKFSCARKTVMLMKIFCSS